MSAELIGSRISLISKKDIRYEGILYNIDVASSSVTLQEVKIWGTETRVEGAGVPASSELLPCIVFRGQDIKDLHVHDTPAEAPNAAAANDEPLMTPPPGAMSVSPVAPAPAHTAAAMARGEGQKGKYQPPHKNPNYRARPGRGGGGGGGNAAPPGPSGPHSVPGMGDHLQSRAMRGGGGIDVQQGQEFDFQAALAEFDKDAMRKEVLGTSATAAGTAAGAGTGGSGEEGGDGDGGGGDGDGMDDLGLPVVKKYNKSSFFDEISCDALTGRDRSGAYTERKLNTETFGATGVNTGNRRWGGGRGRGGYRGGYRSYEYRSNSNQGS